MKAKTYSIWRNAKTGKWIVEGGGKHAPGQWNPCGKYSTREKAVEAATMIGDKYTIVREQ